MAAEAAFSAFLQVIIANVGNAVMEELRLIIQVGKEIRNLTNEVKMLEAYLRDAAQKQQSEEAVRLWLANLQKVVYDSYDLLDECEFEARRRKLKKFPQFSDSTEIINVNRILFQRNIAKRIIEIMVHLDNLKKQSIDYGLQKERENGSRTAIDRGESSSLEPPLIPIRIADETKIRDCLLARSDVAGDAGTSVVSVVGIGGLGKTTVAQRVYNDELVSQNFAVRSWVYFSRHFNEVNLTRAVLESVDGFSHPSVTSLDNLQKMLLNKLRGRKFLIVLDDVWLQDWRQWRKLRVPLLQGAMGSKILVTTRSLRTAEAMGASEIHHLKPLEDDDWWSLFYHFISQQNPTMKHAELQSFSGEIFSHNGLPSSAADLAFRFSQEPDRRKWRNILRSAMSDISLEVHDNQSQSAGLTYELLPVNVKPCFAFCAMFPKGFVFEREELISLWMAQGFIKPSEDLGNRYFDFMVSRLLFQQSRFDRNSNRFKYIMHESVRDSARYASKGECAVLELGQKVEETRHLSLICHESQLNPSLNSFFDQLKGLYTLMVFGESITEVPDYFIKKLERLRALDLSNTRLVKLPDSIHFLKHLRCLQLRNTKISRLPDALGNLFFLQTLGLRNCFLLEELPKDLRNLHKLRHIDLHWDEDSMVMIMEEGDEPRSWIRKPRMRSMPPGIGSLVHLQTLSRFVAGKKYNCGIRELKNLNDLHGELLVSNLQNVQQVTEAKEADLRSKQHLEFLGLHWDDNIDERLKSLESFTERERIERILYELQPHTNLKGLRLTGYLGSNFPEWVGSPSFCNLTALDLINCIRSQFLPPLGNLPKLRKLRIVGMDEVKEVNCVFCVRGNATPFPALEKLHFEKMTKLQQWSGDGTCAFRSLRELVIRDCYRFEKITHHLPSLQILVMEQCPRLTSLPDLSSLQSLKLKHKKQWLMRSPSPSLTSLSSWRSLNSLRRLEISCSDTIISFPEDWVPTSLVYLGVKDCSDLRLLTDELQKLTALEDLEIQTCPQLSSLPDLLGNMKTLTCLEISNCPFICTLPSSLPTNLQILSISHCPRLKERCQKIGGKDWPKIKDISSVWIDGESVTSSFEPGESSRS